MWFSKRALEKLREWRTPKGSERFWRQVLFFVRCHRINLQGLMEVAEKDSQRIKRGKWCRKKCRFTFSTRFKITGLFKKRGSSKDFKYDLAKSTKTGNVDNIINTIQTRLKITGFKSFVPSPRHFTNFCKPKKNNFWISKWLSFLRQSSCNSSTENHGASRFTRGYLGDWWCGG